MADLGNGSLILPNSLSNERVSFCFRCMTPHFASEVHSCL
jgi:hypothetical protein